MSLEASKWTWTRRGLSPRARLVLLALADCCNHKTASNVCWPSLTCLQYMTELSRSSVCRALDELANRDEPLIFRGTGGGTKSTSYTLAFEPGEKSRVDDSPDPSPDPSARRAQPRKATVGSPSMTLPQSQDETTGSPSVTLPQSQDETTGSPRVTPPQSQGDTGVVPGWDEGSPRVTPGTRKGTGKERESCACGESAFAVHAVTAEMRTLSLAPDLFDWEEIGKRLRPEIDGETVWEKFCAFHHGVTKTVEDWERDWRLWVLRERPPPVRIRPERASRAIGDFLTDQSPSISADFEVIREP